METRQLIICRGIQGSGKSTWAKQWCHEDPEHRIRFNNNDIRNMLGDYWVPNREKVVTATYNTVLAYGMEKGYNIVVDNMNLNPKTCVELEKTVKDFNENYTYDWKYEVEYKDFFIPVDECIRRDAMRPNPIGEKYTGCVSEKESLITPENGFRLIETLEAGMSPLSVVYQRDLEYEKLMNKSNEIQG